MKKAFFALLLLVGAVAMMASAAYADDSYNQDPGIQMSNSRLTRQLPKGQSLGTSAVVFDTTWVGYSATHAPVAGNWWNVFATTVMRPGTGDPLNALWDFEDFSKTHGDSLMGWWPTNDRAGVLGTALTDDHTYVYSCMDFGNETSYMIPGTSGRTWGVVGAWHADPGIGAGTGVTWSPMSGTKSAWCGLRQAGDNSVMDAQTNNPYNANAANFIVQNSAMTVKNFPGYVRAWDQLLYHDLTPVEGQDLTLSFLYRTFMSTAFTAGAGRRGWFHGDPLSTANGNFISSFTQSGPIDSFSVYIGVPVDDAAVTLSTGAVAPVYDTQRRWFSEILKIWDGPTAPYYQLLGKTGKNPIAPDTTGFIAFSQVVPWSIVSTIAHSPLNAAYDTLAMGKVRLVFRVKTNNTGDDLTSSTWGEVGGRGAAQIDDVTVQWGADPAVIVGNFEGNEGDLGNVNNAAGSDPSLYWKSTGKPPALYFHARPLAGLAWNDLCGPVGAGTRTCDMQGNVLDPGNDPTETIGDPSFEAGKNGYYGCLSPTIDLTPTNVMEIPAAKIGASDDYYISYDIYTGAFNVFSTGVLFYYGCSSYPNITPGTKSKIWGDVVTSPSIYYEPDPLCYNNLFGLKAKNMVYTTSPTGVPDSMKVWLGIYNFPLRFGVTVGANPTDGAYMDNVSFALVNKTGADVVGNISSDIWQFFGDAFPVGTGVVLGAGTTAAALDTCGALVKGALNIAQTSANAGLGGARLDILADTVMTSASNLSAVVGDTNSLTIRVDMVFRVLPGVGNYRHNLGDVARHYPPTVGMALLRSPVDQTTLVNIADPADHSFWASYIRNPGAFASASPHPGNEWSNTTWNSARMDTVETNLFPTNNITTGFPVRAGFWQTTLHEADPRFAELGTSRGRCFVIDTTLFTNTSSTNIVCGAAPAWLTDALAPPQSRTGWDGTVTTVEGTKIIPDGLLTPGAHVQYFFRKSQVFGHAGYAMDPDTATISPQNSEGGFDGHRWQQFSVLPDRWKDVAFGGAGMACMLYVDYADRRGDELVWVSVMDSVTGGTNSSKWGAHNGWHKTGDGKSLNKDNNATLQADAFVYGKNAQPGTAWDMFGVRATESSSSVGTRIGARFATQGADLLLGHDAAVAPTPDMLKHFYSSLVFLTGDLNSNDLGPNTDVPEDDLRLIQDYLTSPSLDPGLPKKRSVFISGHGFAESESVDPVHATFLATQLGLSLVNPSYSTLASNTNACSDLTSTSIISTANIYGVGLSCLYTDDVIAYNPAKTGAQNVSFYQNTGAGPYVAGVYHAPDPGNDADNYITLVNGFRFTNLWGRYCATSFGRAAYVVDLKTKIFGAACAAWAAPGGGLDVPQAAGIANFMKISNSVVRSGKATVNFGVATQGRVRVRLYDVTGRLVRTLADKTYPGSSMQSVQWDGRDNSGNASARGVYFARIDYASGAAINGRVVVLQ